MDILVIDVGDVEEMLQSVGLEEGGLAQQALDEAFVKNCDPYVPMDSGVLMESAYIATNFGSGDIVWQTPYAHYAYEGIVYVDTETEKAAFYDKDFGFWSRPGVQKIPSDRLLTFHSGGQRGRKWAERMWADHADDVIAEVEAVIRRGKK